MKTNSTIDTAKLGILLNELRLPAWWGVVNRCGRRCDCDGGADQRTGFNRG